MSDEIKYVRVTSDACTADGCHGILHANRSYSFYRCSTCFATYRRTGVELTADSNEPARDRRAPSEPVIEEIQYSRISTERCAVEACGGQLHSNADCMLYRCPDCHETYMRFGTQLVRDASIPRAIVIKRGDK